MPRGGTIGNNGGGPDGNQHALKYDDPIKRLLLLQAYVKHCEAGYPDDMFEECSMATFKKYARDFPVDFPSDIINKAQAKRAKILWDAGWRGTMGIPIKYKDEKGVTRHGKGFNARSWQFIMMNIVKWRTRDDTTTNDKELPQGQFIIYRPEKLPDNYDASVVAHPPQQPPAPTTTGGVAPNATSTANQPATI